MTKRELQGGTRTPMTYASAGVDLELGDDVSSMLYEAAKKTWGNRTGRLGEVISPFDDFSGIRGIDVSNLPEGTMLNMGFDGVGTKMELAERIGNHRTIAFDLFAMVCDDAVVRGAEPVLIGSILDVNSLGADGEPFSDQIKQLAEGYVGAAKEANVAVVNGEVAELGSRVGGYGPFNYNWGAAVVWFAQRDRMLTGNEVKPGDKIVGLREEGFRSNGLSLVRKIFEHHQGGEWHTTPWKDSSNLGENVLTPSRIYTGAVVDMLGGYQDEPRVEVHGVAHITGGGLPGKLRRAIKTNNLGAMIDNPFVPPEFMSYTQAMGSVQDVEAYRTWNMGQGMVIITPDPDAVMSLAGSHRIKSQVIGEVRDTTDPRILIKSKGQFSEGAELAYS